MPEDWGVLIRRHRIRTGFTQARLADVLGVSQRTISRWERGEGKPGLDRQRQLRDLAWGPPALLLRSLAASIAHCPFPRALSRTPRLRLQTLSMPAIVKRPSVTEWIGRDLAPIAHGILQEMLDDRALQRNIAKGDIACVVATTRSVLRTAEHPRIGIYRTVITYFFHEGTFYSDAMSMAVPQGTPLGYRPIAMDEVVRDP